MAIVHVVLGMSIFIKKRHPHHAQAAHAKAMVGGKLFAKRRSWNLKSFMMLVSSERS
jgi:hypothetical protein